ncbi:MAG: PfkB family carbohydrate kinase [Sphaerochaetaceae bacterium]
MIGFLGEALVDLIAEESHDGNLVYFQHIGGCALNAAVAAARLNLEVLFIGRISKDYFGKQIENHFRKNGVTLDEALLNCDENSSLAFAFLDKDKNATYNFYTEKTSIEAIKAKQIIESLNSFNNIDYLHIGSLSLALEASGKEILKALKTLKQRPFILFDPNVRMSAIKEKESYLRRVSEAMKLSDLVKLSDEDLSSLYPSLKTEEAIEHIFSKGVKNVVLTKGKKGMSWFSSDNLRVDVDAKEVVVVDTVAGGDTVSAALLFFLDKHRIAHNQMLKEHQIKQALEFASKAASITVSRRGADPPYYHEL